MIALIGKFLYKNPFLEKRLLSKIRKSPSRVTSPPIDLIASGSNNFAAGRLTFFRLLASFYLNNHGQISTHRLESQFKPVKSGEPRGVLCSLFWVAFSDAQYSEPDRRNQPEQYHP